MAEEGYVGKDSDKVFTEVCENCHRQDGVGGEVKEMESIGVHDVAEEIREGRAEPAIEEQCEEGVPIRSQFRCCSREYPRARMRTSLRRPEEAEVLPQLFAPS